MAPLASAQAPVPSAPLPAGRQFRELGKYQLPASYSAFSIASGDVDGDGDVDLVFGTPQAPNVLLLGDGFGGFRDASLANMPQDLESTFGIALTDVDVDGDLDILCANMAGTWGPGQNRLYLNDGTGRFTDSTSGRLPVAVRYTTCLAVGDVDGDGDPDIVFGNTGHVSPDPDELLLNDGRGRFSDVTATQFPNPGTSTKGIAVGDIDGDGDLDIVPATYGVNDVWLNDGRGSFKAAYAGPLTGLSEWRLSLGDVDGDGDLDLIGARSGPNALFKNDGTGRFIPVSTGWPVSTFTSLAAALQDVDLDGDLDAVFANELMQVGWPPMFVYQNEIYVNDGRGRFTDATSSRLPVDRDATRAVHVADLDGDGDAEIVFGNYGTPSRIYTNLHRQLSSPDPARLGSTFRVGLSAEPGYGPSGQLVIPLLGLVPSNPRVGTPFGCLGLSPTATVAGNAFAVPVPEGTVHLSLTIPNDARLLGRVLYMQALAIHRVTPLHAHLTNVTADPFVR